MSRKEEFEIPPDVMAALERQDAALALLERLRAEEPLLKPRAQAGGGRRDFRRWPIPTGVAVELHDGLRWQKVDCMDMGVGGARLGHLPDWMSGPAPARLKAPGISGVLALADVMWRDKEGRAGVRFEFHDDENATCGAAP